VFLNEDNIFVDHDQLITTEIQYNVHSAHNFSYTVHLAINY